MMRLKTTIDSSALFGTKVEELQSIFVYGLDKLRVTQGNVQAFLTTQQKNPVLAMTNQDGNQ